MTCLNSDRPDGTKGLSSYEIKLMIDFNGSVTKPSSPQRRGERRGCLEGISLRGLSALRVCGGEYTSANHHLIFKFLYRFSLSIAAIVLRTIDITSGLVEILVEFPALAERHHTVGLGSVFLPAKFELLPLEPGQLSPGQFAGTNSLADALLLFVLPSVNPIRILCKGAE